MRRGGAGSAPHHIPLRGNGRGAGLRFRAASVASCVRFAHTKAARKGGSRQPGRSVVSQVAADLRAGGGEFADHEVPPPSEADRGELLRALASDAIRGGLERHFDVKLAFQNCHRVAAFAPEAVGGERHRAFVSPRGQLLNQSPTLRNC
ncbi:SCO5389 family protein [Frankia sp. AgKG'84/4]|uniref:SCO5389 family protein n=1 Tax=Frankia sp. AgKG'84/4 TaxID=573490 RepID=UPI00200E2E43|nr:SCO5389 family protein [Frankia sp. AgKG'84/4]MCL9793448.1 SCO5389 family protein [Frankia sp. AgKG'84/4]